MQYNQTTPAQYNIIVDNFITLSHQAMLSPEIIFFNKPLLNGNKQYYKLFVNLNYNPNIVGVSHMLDINTFTNLDFKLFNQTDLKEIKPTAKLASTLTLDNNLQDRFNLIEYDVPVEYWKEQQLNLSYGLSYLDNQVLYNGTGQIHLTNHTTQTAPMHLQQNLVSYFRNFDFNVMQTDGISHDLITVSSNIHISPLVVTRPVETLAEIELFIVDNTTSEITNNASLNKMISQIKNNKIFPHFMIENVAFKNLVDSKQYYKNDLSLSVVAGNDQTYKIVSNTELKLDDTLKMLSFIYANQPHPFFINPYSWAEDQALIIDLKHFGTAIKLQLDFISFASMFTWNQDKAFIYQSETVIKYHFDASFWSRLSITDNEQLKGVLQQYEI